MEVLSIYNNNMSDYDRRFFSKYIDKAQIKDQCIVLDIDETLVHTYQPNAALPHNLIKNVFTQLRTDPKYFAIRPRLYHITMEIEYGKPLTYYGVKRPYLDEFIQFCFNHFKIVVIWSAGHPEYVKSMINVIFSTKYHPHIIFSSENLYSSNNGDIYNKPINTIINSYVDLNKYMSLNNTYIVDDRIDNFVPNPQNGILIPRYSPILSADTILKDQDMDLLKLIRFFKKNGSSLDIKMIDKRKIFDL